MAHVAQWKYKEVEELTALLKQHPVIGIAEIDDGKLVRPHDLIELGALA